MMRLAPIFAVFLSGLAGTAVLAQDQDTPDMQRSNQQFRAREAAKPPQDTSYKNTKEYKAATPEQKQNADDTINRTNKAVEQVKRCHWIECRASHTYDYCVKQPGCSN
jgi:hypothetical protein